MAFRNLSAEWCERVHTFDASWWGCGVVQKKVPRNDVKRLGSFNDRWRFSKTEEAGLRDDHKMSRDKALVGDPLGVPEDVCLRRQASCASPMYYQSKIFQNLWVMLSTTPTA